jgi:hypothetical protein
VVEDALLFVLTLLVAGALWWAGRRRSMNRS